MISKMQVENGHEGNILNISRIYVKPHIKNMKGE